MCEPDEEDVELLLQDPSLAPQFDEMYGTGAADKVLQTIQGRQHSDAATHTEPVPEDVELLLQDPSPHLAAQFDELYGAGASTAAAEAARVKAEEEKAAEAASVKATVQVLPTDFWVAVPHAAAAYKAGSYVEALRLYKHAAALAITQDSLTLSPQQMATLFINTARTLARLSRCVLVCELF